MSGNDKGITLSRTPELLQSLRRTVLSKSSSRRRPHGAKRNAGGEEPTPDFAALNPGYAGWRWKILQKVSPEVKSSGDNEDCGNSSEIHWTSFLTAKTQMNSAFSTDCRLKSAKLPTASSNLLPSISSKFCA
jgi:hypothetical protein